MLTLYTYDAHRGDCLHLRFTPQKKAQDTLKNISNTENVLPCNIMIDTGVIRFAPALRKIFSEISARGERISYLILTHTDEDHLGGILSLLRMRVQIPVDCVIVNYEMSKKLQLGNALLSVQQRNELVSRLIDAQIPILPAYRGDVFAVGGAVLRILSPTEDTQGCVPCVPLGHHRDYGFSLEELAEMPISYKDRSPSNHKSIVFTFEYEGRRLLFTGDAWSEDILAGLDSLSQGNLYEKGNDSRHFDLVKLPHHGSSGNLSESWKHAVCANKFVICTDGLAHPDKQTIAKLASWYDNIEILSPCDWWSKNFLLREDENFRKTHGLIFRKIEGAAVEW